MIDKNKNLRIVVVVIHTCNSNNSNDDQNISFRIIKNIIKNSIVGGINIRTQNINPSLYSPRVLNEIPLKKRSSRNFLKATQNGSKKWKSSSVSLGKISSKGGVLAFIKIIKRTEIGTWKKGTIRGGGHHHLLSKKVHGGRYGCEGRGKLIPTTVSIVTKDFDSYMLVCKIFNVYYWSICINNF